MMKCTVAKTAVCFVFLVLVTAPPAVGQRLAQSVLELLEQRTVRLQIEDDTGLNACLGVRLGPASPQVPNSVELIATAGHCVDFLMKSQRRLIQVTSYGGNHIAGGYCWIFSQSHDVGVVLAAPSLGYYAPPINMSDDPAPASLDIVGMISIGGGDPTPAAGKVVGSNINGLHVLMPGGPGSSGGPVIDLKGNLVGIIIEGKSYPGSAGYDTTLLSSIDLIRFLKSSIYWITDRANKIANSGTCDPATP